MTDYIELQVTDDGVIETEVSEQIVIGGAANLQTKSVSYTPTESAQSAQVTPDVGYDGMSKVNVSVGAISSSYVGSGVTRRTSSDLSKNGATITAPAGYYESSASKSVTSGTAGTPTASKGAVSNHAIAVTPSVTNQSGYISGGTITGTAVSVSASELVSGTKPITENGTGIDVTEYAAVDVNVSGGGGMPGTLINCIELTPASTLTNNNRVDINLSITTNGLVVLLIDNLPSPDSLNYIALFISYFYSSSGNSTYQGNAILRPNGTIGTDTTMMSYNKSTGVLTVGGEYGHFLAGTTYHIYQFEA